MKSVNKEWTIWRATFPVVVQSLAAWKDPHAGTACERYLNSENTWERIAAYDAQRLVNDPQVTIEDKLTLVQDEEWLYKYFTVQYQGLGKPTQTK